MGLDNSVDTDTDADNDVDPLSVDDGHTPVTVLPPALAAKVMANLRQGNPPGLGVDDNDNGDGPDHLTESLNAMLEAADDYAARNPDTIEDVDDDDYVDVDDDDDDDHDYVDVDDTCGLEFGRDLAFASALDVLDAGGAVARSGWNGKAMFIYKTSLDNESKVVHRDQLWDAGGSCKQWMADADLEYIKVLPYIVMKTADNCLVPWLASQTDLAAGDWYEL